MIYEFYFNLLLYELQMKKYEYITHAKYSHYKITDKAKLQPCSSCLPPRRHGSPLQPLNN